MIAVSEVARPIVDPDAVGLSAAVGDPCVEVAIAVEVTKGDICATRVTQRLTAVGEGAGGSAVVEPNSICLAAAVCDPCIEITIAVEIAKGNSIAYRTTQQLTAVGKGSGTVV